MIPPNYPKRLIEVDLPIKRISEHARREKSIRHGHISTLHIWWARRPLAACRAVICAALWPDPAQEDCPPKFREDATTIMARFCNPIGRTDLDFSDPIALRKALLDFIADFANWDNSTKKEYLETARALTQSAHEALGGAPGTRPLVVDPFAGGGSIPLEALRVGADAFASDLNPVAVLLNKVVLEYIPKYGQTLADEVRKWGEWIEQEARKELANFYPKDSDGATPIAYIWARTIISEAPDDSDIPVEIPLLRSMWLAKKGNQRALRWIRDRSGRVKTTLVQRVTDKGTKTVQIPEIEIFPLYPEDIVGIGTVKGGSVTCPITGFTTSAKRVKAQLAAQNGGANNSRLIAVYVQRESSRDFRLPVDEDFKNFFKAKSSLLDQLAKYPDLIPTELINPIRPYKNTRGLSAVTRIGCYSFQDIYNYRQLLCIETFYRMLKSIHNIKSDDPLLRRAVITCLAFAIDRLVSQNTSLSRWDSSRSTIKGAFSKQALAVVWDFSEANPFSDATGGWDGAIEWITKVIEANLPINVAGIAIQESGMNSVLPQDSVTALVTDPPYFAAIPYGDLSDFFYVWLRRGLSSLYPDIFKSPLTVKDEELIVTNAQLNSEGMPKDDAFFRKGMTTAFAIAREAVIPTGIGVIVYAEGSTAGWEAILAAILASGWIVTSSWPIYTEMENRTRAQGSASLQSSIHLVCRPRENSDGSVREDDVGYWSDVLAELPLRIHAWLPSLAAEGVVGADAIFSCLGPALEIYSRYSRVEKASGEVVTLKEYLEEVWAAVSREALGIIFEGVDCLSLEEDARLTAMWLWTLSTGGNGGSFDDQESQDDDAEEGASGKGDKMSGFVLEYDAARKIAQGLGAHLESLTALVEVKGDKARLLPVSERTSHLFGQGVSTAAAKRRKKKKEQQTTLSGSVVAQAETEKSGPAGELGLPAPGATALDRLHQAMLLFSSGRSDALKRFIQEDVGQDQGLWSLAQSLSALYPAGSEERRWVEGVLTRKKSLGM